MEKITYPSLVEHLQEQYGFYNQLYLDHELRYGIMDRRILHQWIVQVIEPVIIEISKNGQENLPNIFKAFFSELLQLSGTGLLVTYEQEYKTLWKVCINIPSIIGSSPLRVLKALHSGLQSVRTYQPSMTLQWIALMDKTVSPCISFDDLLNCGRMNAWFCGLSHLREKCIALLPKLSIELKKKLEEHSPLSNPLEKILTQPWIGKKDPKFIKVTGGFTGFGGAFSQPPMLRNAGDYVQAGDSEHNYLLFADEFGQVLLHYSNDSFKASNDLSPLKEFKKIYNGDVPYNDISSCIMKKNTFFLTRHSSHYIYIYGWSNDH